MVRGPLRATIVLLLELGWRPIAPSAWGEPLPAHRIWRLEERGSWAPFCRSLASSAMAQHWPDAARHWSGTGLERGGDFTSLKAHLRHFEKKGLHGQYGALHTVAIGATWPRARRVSASLPGVLDDTCTRCGRAPETDIHRYYQCPANRDIPDRAVQSTQHLAERACAEHELECYWLRGIVPVSLAPIPDPPDHMPTSCIGGLELFARGRHFYLDGSGGARSSDPRLRRCGWGSALMNFSSPLEPRLRASLFGGVPGLVQTVPRSELLAAVRTLELSDPEPVVLFSDSAYFVDGTADDREHALASGNGDLWQRYWQAVDLHLGCVLVVKVKAHAELEALSMGHIKWWHFAGNHFADRLACRGAESAALPEATVSALLAAEAIAWQVQSRLACILAHIAATCAPSKDELEARDRARAEARSTRELAKPPVLSLEQALQATSHKPHRLGGKFKCFTCMKTALLDGAVPWLATPCIPLEVTRGPGGGPAVPAAIVSIAGKGIHSSHRLSHKRGVMWCGRCGCYAVLRVANLGLPCRGYAAGAGATALGRLAAGFTPSRGMLQWPRDPEEGDLAEGLVIL